jgi:dTDP-4-dehydrorhamnose 3,5-epimerase
VVRVKSLELPGVYLIQLIKHEDRRGFFSETYSKRNFAAASIDCDWVQENHIVSTKPGTLRGLHFQRPPHAQAKLVRVNRGAVYDVVVDLRVGSPSYGRWISKVISALSWNSIYIPKGFAHGYLTLDADSEVQYKVDAYYAPDFESGIVWNDLTLAIDWPLKGLPVISQKDRELKSFVDLASPFVYEMESS